MPLSGLANESRPVWAEIDLDYLRNNLEALRQLLGPGIDIMAVVKGNAYGHGAVEISQRLSSWGVGRFAVATAGEGIELRRSGIVKPILVMAALAPQEAEVIVASGLTPMLFTLEQARAFDASGARAKRKIGVHLRIDTGNGTMGILPEDVDSFLAGFDGLRWLEVEGVFTHLYGAYLGDEQQTRGQLERFDEVIRRLRENGRRPFLAHTSSSPSILAGYGLEYGMVRPGNLLYGLSPEVDHDLHRYHDRLERPSGEDAACHPAFVPVMQLKARVIDVKSVRAGQSLGYYKSRTVRRHLSLATIPMGYADGFPLAYLKNAPVLIRGRRAPIYGKVTMDYMMVDVTHLPEVRPGDEVVIFGRQGEDEIRVDELAARARFEWGPDKEKLLTEKTVSRAAFCLLGRRIPRLYLEHGEIVATA